MQINIDINTASIGITGARFFHTLEETKFRKKNSLAKIPGKTHETNKLLLKLFVKMNKYSGWLLSFYSWHSIIRKLASTERYLMIERQFPHIGSTLLNQKYPHIYGQ